VSGEAGLEEGMTYVERLDFRDQAHKHEMERLRLQEAEATKREKYKNAQRRQDTLMAWGISFFVAAAVIAISWLIYKGVTGPDDGRSIEQEREQSCVESGGGWVPKDLLDVSDSGLCVYPGKSAG
jgi:hypothetical protein